MPDRQGNLTPEEMQTYFDQTFEPEGKLSFEPESPNFDDRRNERAPGEPFDFSGYWKNYFKNPNDPNSPFGQDEQYDRMATRMPRLPAIRCRSMPATTTFEIYVG